MCKPGPLLIDLISDLLSDKRKEMEKLISENGGRYSAELTKRCTHLIADISFETKFDNFLIIGHMVIFWVNSVVLIN